MQRCAVRQLLRWKAAGNKAAVATVQASRWYPEIREDAIRQWNLGNRGAPGEWR